MTKKRVARALSMADVSMIEDEASYTRPGARETNARSRRQRAR